MRESSKNKLRAEGASGTASRHRLGINMASIHHHRITPSARSAPDDFLSIPNCNNPANDLKIINLDHKTLVKTAVISAAINNRSVIGAAPRNITEEPTQTNPTDLSY